MRFLLSIFLSGALIGLLRACEPPDCNRNDCGTCGNSCCTLEYLIASEPDMLFKRLVASLKFGGPDQHYTYVGGDDLRPYNISASFILQGVHTTFVKKYNDTLNFAIFPETQQKYFPSRLRAFSISQIKGAYCDAGQNYKNLVQLIKGLGIEFVENWISGCPPLP